MAATTRTLTAEDGAPYEALMSEVRRLELDVEGTADFGALLKDHAEWSKSILGRLHPDTEHFLAKFPSAADALSVGLTGAEVSWLCVMLRVRQQQDAGAATVVRACLARLRGLFPELALTDPT